MDEGSISSVLEWGYEKAINGIPGSESVEELANYYLSGSGSIDDKVNSLIKWQKAKCFTSGFITGLGGIITLPVSIPANVSSVLYVQIRMIATIAYMGGYNVKDDRVKTMVYACLCGDSAKQILKDVGIDIGQKLTVSLIKKIPTEVIKRINKIVGFKLVTKFGEKGAINIVKAVPFIGGAIGGGIDYMSASTVGSTAKKVFINNTL